MPLQLGQVTCVCVCVCARARACVCVCVCVCVSLSLSLSLSRALSLSLTLSRTHARTHTLSVRADVYINVRGWCVYACAKPHMQRQSCMYPDKKACFSI